jgi:hypothetical protein
MLAASPENSSVGLRTRRKHVQPTPIALMRALDDPPLQIESCHFDNSRSDRCLWRCFWHEANFDTLVASATHFLFIGVRNSDSGNEFGRDAIGDER